MPELRIKAVSRFVMEVMYFYDGEAPVKDGVLTLPISPQHLPWVQRAWIKGFRLNPDTDEFYNYEDLLAMYENESAKSEGEDLEGPANRGQSFGDDGIRPSELPRSESVPSERLGSGSGHGPAKGTGRKPKPTHKAVRTKK